MASGDNQKLPLLALTAMVVGSMVGAGIFNLPGRFGSATGPFGAIIAWLIAGTGMYMLARVFQLLAEKKPDIDSGVFAYAKAGFDRNVWLSTQPFMSAADTGTLSGPSAERAEQLFAATPKMYELIRKHGVKTAWGSDILFSPQLAPRQSFMLTHLSQWHSNAEALRMATSGNAELLTLSNLRNPYPGKLGVIEKDALADILVLNANPLQDIHALERPAETLAVIMKDGRIHKNTL